MMKLMFIFTVLIKLVISAPTADDLLISLPDGLIQGKEYSTVTNRIYYGWRGIPFAAPPVGLLRFEPPQPPKPWTDVRNADQDGKACISASFAYNPDTQSEDCLFIHVYAPSIKPADKLPVMFWIYGGGFMGGDALKSSYGPDFFMEEDVIVVSFNYRVGAFGFLSTGDNALRGNYGLKDQLLALKWTRQNIALFGGDPEKITIWGESAGGQSVGLHLVSKQSAGLFRAAIVESGSGLTNSSVDLKPLEYTFQVASLIPGGDYGNDTQKLKDFLLNKTVDEINDALSLLNGEDLHAWPVLEVEADDAFLTQSPYELFKGGNFAQVPTLMGICAEEGLLTLNDLETATGFAALLERDQLKVIPADLRPDASDEQAVIEKIRSIYLPENKTFSTDLIALTKYVSDNKFARALMKQAELQSQYVPVYLYMFSYFGRNRSVPFIDGVEKAGHGSELPFLFNMNDSGNDTDDSNLLVQNRMVKLWANFAKDLNPTPKETELFSNITWPTIAPDNLQYLNINGTLELLSDMKGTPYRLWNETYYSYGKKPFVTF